MEKPSSTSNSSTLSPSGGFPWSLLIALVVLAMVELGVRQLPEAALIPYRNDETQYEAVADYLAVSGPADVCIVGSSRAREAVVADELAMLCNEGRESPVAVANYSCPGARAEENEAIVKSILRRGKPRMIVYGVSPRQLLERERSHDEIALFQDWNDWRDSYREDQNLAMERLPIVVRTWIGQSYRTLRYRRKAGIVCSDFLLALHYGKLGGLSFTDLLSGRAFPCPVRGERSRWHSTHADVSLVSRPISLERVHRYVERLRWKGRFFIQGGQRDHLRGLMSACEDAGVQLVLAEVPMSDLVHVCYPPGLYTGFLEEMHLLAEEFHVSFVTVGDLDLHMADSEFLDQTHLNYKGALHFTRELARHLIIPALQASSPGF